MPTPHQPPTTPISPPCVSTRVGGGALHQPPSTRARSKPSAPIVPVDASSSATKVVAPSGTWKSPVTCTQARAPAHGISRVPMPMPMPEPMPVLVHTARRHLAADEHLAAGRAGRAQLVDHLQPLRVVAQQRVEGGHALHALGKPRAPRRRGRPRLEGVPPALEQQRLVAEVAVAGVGVVAHLAARTAISAGGARNAPGCVGAVGGARSRPHRAPRGAGAATTRGRPRRFHRRRHRRGAASAAAGVQRPRGAAALSSARRRGRA